MRFSLASPPVLASVCCALFSTASTQAVKSPLAALPLPISPDPSFNFQMLISLGSIPYSAGDVLAAARLIEPNNFYSFNSTFYELAVGKMAAASAAAAAQSPVNAQNTYFAASNYFRSADFYLHGNWSDPLIDSYWVNQTECFNKAIATLPVPGKRVTLTSDGFNTIGIYFAPNKLPQKRPTLIIVQGYDAAQEDSYMQMGAAAVQRGWNVLTLEGPGQPTVRRNQGLGFIPDYEKVVTPAVDYLAKRPDVDMDRLALAGISMGGYLVARAAAFEPRIKAVVLDDGVWSVFDSITVGFPPQLLQLYTSGNQSAFDTIINDAIVYNTSASSSARWGIDQGLWSFKTHSTYDLLKQSTAYVFQPIADKINVPVLVNNAADDADFPGQAIKVYNELKSLNKSVTLHDFTGPASYHCQAGDFETANAVIFGWLESVFY